MLSALFLKTAQDRDAYRALLDSIAARYPYHRPEYFEAFAGSVDDLVCLVWNNGNSTVLYPGHLRPIEDAPGFVDFSSPYGYSGPIANSGDPGHLRQFWPLADQWFSENNVVAEFVRFPLDSTKDTYNGELVSALSNVKGRIIDEDSQWMNFDHKVRKNVKRARRENLRFSILTGDEVSADTVKKFQEVYIPTMKRANAGSQFFYSDNDFLSYATNNPGCCAFAFIYDGDRIVSVEMVLRSDDSIYSFLGGTHKDAFPKRPNDLLKFELINWARWSGLEFFVLGGGYGADDGIFQYKRAFFPEDVVDWMTGRKIVSPTVYRELCDRNLARQNLEKAELVSFHDKDFFPEYRKTL
jgi:hypothetical protein